MGQPADARLTPELAREICERTASAAVLEGSIASLGTQYVAGVARQDTAAPATSSTRSRCRRRGREDVLNALSQIARKFRTRVGESLATVEKHSTPLDEATTPSLEALKAYSAAMEAQRYGRSPSPRFRCSSVRPTLDPQFAMAFAHMGRVRTAVSARQRSPPKAPRGRTNHPHHLHYRYQSQPSRFSRHGALCAGT